MEKVTWNVEGPLSCEAESGYPPPGSVGRTCPQEGKQPSQLAILGLPAAAGSPGGCRSRPFSFLLPWAILGRRGCEDWSWVGERTGFGFLCFVSLKCYPPVFHPHCRVGLQMGKRPSRRKGRTPQRKPPRSLNLSRLLWLGSR